MLTARRAGSRDLDVIRTITNATHDEPETRLYTNSLMERNIRVYEQAGFRHMGRRPNLRRPGWWFVDMARHVSYQRP